jgi:putative toxin-antitoxin system antitoxin component (TIGR02293 family)
MPEATMAKSLTRTTRAKKRPSLDDPYLEATPMGLVSMVREGVPYPVFEYYMTGLGLSDQAAAGILHIAPRTLARRKGGRLDPQESERLLRLVRLVAQATEVLGDRAKALHWLGAPNRALGAIAPLALLDTDIGTQEVEAVLTRIDHGVFA